MNGEPAVRFTSANSQYLNIASGFSGNQSTMTLMAVLKGGGTSALFTTTNSGQTDELCFDNYVPWMNIAFDKTAYLDTSQIPTGGLLAVTCGRNANNHILLSTFSNGLQYDGPRDGSDTDPIPCGNALLGTTNNTAYFNGDLCEFLVYNRVLSAAEIQTTDTYLANKYGLTVPVDTPPTVSITAPANNAGYAGPATVNITVSATANTGAITEVQFYNGDSDNASLIDTETSSPYSFVWDAVPPGNYTLMAQAYDSMGAKVCSTPITITVNATCATPSFIPAPGTYSTAQSVTISTSTGGATIRYTTNGTTPSSDRGHGVQQPGEHQRYLHTAGHRLYDRHARQSDRVRNVYAINAVPTTGLLLWLKAGAITGVNNGGVVSTWPDSSGSGNNATQTTTGIQPTYATGELNGQPAVSFASAS